jgi:hypothetical protein
MDNLGGNMLARLIKRKKGVIRNLMAFQVIGIRKNVRALRQMKRFIVRAAGSVC